MAKDTGKGSCKEAVTGSQVKIRKPAISVAALALIPFLVKETRLAGGIAFAVA